MKKLQELISIFLNSKEKGLQLDIHRKNDEVLLQIFKQYDIVNWKVDFDILNKEGYCVCLFFNDQKTQNKKNIARFKESDFYKNFIFSKSLGVDSYFYLSEKNDSVKELESFCLDIINEVYNYKDQVIFRMNAY